MKSRALHASVQHDILIPLLGVAGWLASSIYLAHALHVVRAR